MDSSCAVIRKSKINSSHANKIMASDDKAECGAGVVVENAASAMCKGTVLNACDKKESDQDSLKSKKTHFLVNTVVHYFTLLVVGLLTWGLVWCIFGDDWRWDGKWFRLSVVAIIAWASGDVLQGVTTLPPLLAALTTGILVRHYGFLDIRHYPEVDGFLRKIYPVIILGKGSLGWNLGYMRKEWKQVFTLGVLPWSMEVITLAACTNLLLDFPWIWGVMLGSFYASISCPVLMPSIQSLQMTLQPSLNWVQLICTSGGIDTLLSVGVFGLVYSYIFFDTNHTYKIVKMALTLFIGIILGATWGNLAKLFPRHDDQYVTCLRVLIVLLGGLFCNFFTSMFGWGGVAGVAVLVCNATAAMHWSRDGWKQTQNPAVTTYKILWATCEPVLFAYTGTYYVLDDETWDNLPTAAGILGICLTVRLTVAALVSWQLKFKEKVFFCCAWSTKSIVEAVLCPVAMNTLILQHVDEEDSRIELANNMIRLTVLAIYITTPIGYLLTNHLGPVLLQTKKTYDVEVQDRKAGDSAASE